MIKGRPGLDSTMRVPSDHYADVGKRDGMASYWKSNRRAIAGWAIYDWANSAFATTVIAGFYPVFFNQYWSTGVETTTTTARLGLINSIAGLVVAVLAPFIGAIADRSSSRKRFLIFFAYMGAALTSSLYLVNSGRWVAASIIYILASIGFSGGMVFYDSMLKDVSHRKNADMISSLGYSLGYLGGGVLFAINVWMTVSPARFGLSDASEAVKFSFLTVGIWWAVFTIPLILFVREKESGSGRCDLETIRSGIKEILSTFREIRSLRPILLFLLAYWFYIDGVDTIVRMAVDYGLSIGLERKDLILALLITQFVGFPSALGFGILGRKVGAEKAIFIALIVYLGVTVWASMMTSRAEFYALAVIIGLVQGGIQALSRSYYSRMIPEGKSAEYFGFYNMTGKFAAVLGPILMGGVGLAARRAGLGVGVATRISILSLSLLFITGGVLLFISRRKSDA
ncbi:MAG: MFS transporter [Bacteroidales bacterium]|nr:MFS transporter [Candidatus Latescibacterota bacterium]